MNTPAENAFIKIFGQLDSEKFTSLYMGDYSEHIEDLPEEWFIEDHLKKTLGINLKDYEEVFAYFDHENYFDDHFIEQDGFIFKKS